ncbi:hypothetical protein AB6N24_11360 [Cellulomonas sp. 179-A 4D5 NHS]|uniref:hypothetical protein n=1 Tax=Cellulomonas sp. 179-A 4D5 NHS TaxID=3142378 RepID=UPI0039A2926B
MVSRAVGVRARAVLWPLVALLTLVGFAWMHVVAVTDPGTAQHHRVPAAVADAGPAPGGHAAHAPESGSGAQGAGSDGHGHGHGHGSDGHGEGSDAHAAMVGCLLALTGVAVWALRRRRSPVRQVLSFRRERATRRGPTASWPVPARGCGPPRIALCVLRV